MSSPTIPHTYPSTPLQDGVLNFACFTLKPTLWYIRVGRAIPNIKVAFSELL